MKEEGEEGEEGEVCERRKTSWSEILERDEKQVWRRIARRGRQGIDARASVQPVAIIIPRRQDVGGCRGG
jgi:hypothetical protein